ncbi:MAG: ISAs1 family transposase [Thermomicrobiales bacterium]
MWRRFSSIERFGQAKRAWLETLVPLPHGIPSHDMIGRVFAALDPDAFETAFLGWVQSLITTQEGVVAIDGKTLRRSHDRPQGQRAVHLVSAWSCANHVVLGQVATDAKSNEITAIPALLRTLVLADTVVTIDAMGCHGRLPGRLWPGVGTPSGPEGESGDDA